MAIDEGSPDAKPLGTSVFTARLQALLFTDIVDSSGLKGRIGLKAYTNTLKRHNAIFQELVSRCDEADIVKATGDGFFARFPTASDAVACAMKFQRAVSGESWPSEAVAVRVGIHLGEVAMVHVVGRTDIVGTPADTAARIMSLAAAGQVLLSRRTADEARPMLHGDSFRWTNHGMFSLKGLPDATEVWEIADAAAPPLPPPSNGKITEGAAGPRSAHDPYEHIGHYRLLEILGAGGMGTVYKAERTLPPLRTVALKVIKPGIDTEEVIARFSSEREILARMNHPNIASVLDAGKTDKGRPYFVMEYVRGVPITHFADAEKLSVRERLALFLQVCDAISHAHSKAILHRDIKDSNVLAFLADKKPMVKVIDFGIAKALSGERIGEGEVYNTRHGTVVGTIEVMSPEQAEGSADLDTRSDVYSLGVLLYELLSGAKPFDAETMSRATELERRRIVREVDPPRPSLRLTALGADATKIAHTRQSRVDVLARELRGELEWIPLMAMRKERQRRYASPLLLAEDIQNYLAGRPLLAGPESKVYRLRKFSARHRVGIAIAAAAVLASAVGIGIYIHDIRAAERRTELALDEARHQRDQAAREQRIADAVNHIIADMLYGADPKVNNKPTVKEAAADLIDRFDRGEIKDVPIVEAAIRDTVGNVERGMSQFSESESNLTQALALRRKYLAPTDPSIAVSLDHLGHLYKDTGEYDRAEPLYNEGLDIFKQSAGLNNADAANLLSNRGSLYQSLKKYDLAEADIRQALEIRQHLDQPNPRDVAQSLNALVIVLQSQGKGKLTEAERYSTQAVDLARKIYPADHPNIARALLSRAALRLKQARYDDAEKDCREALRIDLNALHDPQHPYIANCDMLLATILEAQNKLDDAAPVYKDALDIRRAKLPAGHPDLVASLTQYIRILKAQGKTTEAARYQTELASYATTTRPD